MSTRVSVAVVVGVLILTAFAPPSVSGGAPIKLPDIENPKVMKAGKIGRSGGTLITGEISDPRCPSGNRARDSG